MRNPIIAALSIPSFLFLLISEFFSQFAMNLLNFILLIVVFNLSKSNLAVAGVVLSFTLPSIAFGILAGAYVDKWNKKNVLVMTNFLRALAVIPLIFISSQLFLVYVFSFIVSLVTQFFIPAETPIIPHLVKKDLLLSANALFSMGIFWLNNRSLRSVRTPNSISWKNKCFHFNYGSFCNIIRVCFFNKAKL